ncbi:MAG: FAD-binding oxidoreductase [Phenylobacterium sp.]|jgi:sarcosine oxidase subunit beta|uniref:NAD(P)/FAD-dependent oxidoreductase n=1 Tax=Phenylobacterium sp. TaxID=1871053 RepID=UPI0025E237B2|nr:FAD-dependent oxidoreductase [Phenylobacterium sp.]MCA3755951.1 FAD-binding oxidoreductase [Phenylobacterium sp.]MCA6246556.1 FAD-binding oxidoreductase [Phenylobacterium sp.]
MADTADVIIVGAGIIGLSIAHQLLRRAKLRILVLEKGAALGEGSTGASSAVCRFRYTYDEMVCLARDGVAAYRNWGEFLGEVETTAVYHRLGSLWFSPLGGDWARREAARLHRLGVAAEVLGDADLSERYPALNTCLQAPDLERGSEHPCEPGGGRHLFEPDAGYVNPMDAANDLLRAVKAKGASVRFNAKVERVLVRSERASGIQLVTGEIIHAPVVINAAGPWCNRLSAPLYAAGAWDLAPTRIQVVHVDCPPPMRGRLPICADLTSGIYFREQRGSGQIVVGSLLESDEREVVSDPDDFARHHDDEFARLKLHALQHRLPGLKISSVRGYSGLYTVNRQDVHPIVGQTHIDGFYMVNGCSGHGFKLAPILGAIVARAITGVRDSFDTDVDPAFLAVDRAPLQLDLKSAMA